MVFLVLNASYSMQSNWSAVLTKHERLYAKAIIFLLIDLRDLFFRFRVVGGEGGVGKL